MITYRITAMTGRSVKFITLEALDISSAIDKAFAIWRKSGVLSDAEIHFTNVRVSEV